MLHETELRKDFVKGVATAMLAAARTAPKARGNDRLFLAILTKDEINSIALAMQKIASSGGPAFFERDALNLQIADAVVLMGTRYEPQELQLCGYCGFENCNAKRSHSDVPCVFNTGDLGIAIGSAVSVAMDHRVDNRVFYSAGYAAIKIGLTPPEVKIAYAIPLSVSAKNPFFDRK